jgi:Sensors of blue-light using FAD
MSLVRLAYRSRAADGAVGVERLVALRDIHAKAVASNTRHGVTGFLAFTLNHFLQVIEGEKAAVMATYERIARDSRHKDIQMFGVEPSDGRMFERWSMGAIFDEGIIREAMNSIGMGGEMDVTRLKGEQIVDVLSIMALRHGGGARSAA